MMSSTCDYTWKSKGPKYVGKLCLSKMQDEQTKNETYKNNAAFFKIWETHIWNNHMYTAALNYQTHFWKDHIHDFSKLKVHRAERVSTRKKKHGYITMVTEPVLKT